MLFHLSYILTSLLLVKGLPLAEFKNKNEIVNNDNTLHYSKNDLISGIDFKAIQVSIGSNNQTLLLKLDTTSSDFWVNSNSNEFCLSYYPIDDFNLNSDSKLSNWNEFNDNLKNNLNNSINQFQSSYNSELTSMINNSESISSTINIEQYISNRESNFSKLLKNENESVTKEISQFLKTNKISKNSFWSQITKTIKSEELQFGNKITSDVAVLATKNSYNSNISFVTLATKTKNQYLTLVTTAKISSTNSKSSKGNQFASTVTSKGGQFATDVTSKGGQFATDVTSKGGQFATKVTSKGGQFATDVTSKGGQFATDVTSKGGQFATEVTSKGGQFATDVTSKGGQFATDVTSKGGQFATDVTSKGGQFATDVTSWGGQVATDVTSGFGDVTSNVVNGWGQFTSNIVNWKRNYNDNKFTSVATSTIIIEKKDIIENENIDEFNQSNSTYINKLLNDCSLYGVFDDSKSKSFYTNYDDLLLLNNSETIGFIGNDLVNISNSKINSSFGIAIDSDSNIGILGLGRSTSNSTFQSISDLLEENGNILKSIYHLNINNDKSSLLFGAIDYSLIDGNITFFSLLNDTEAISLKLSGLNITNDDESTSIIDDEKNAIIDSTTNDLILPEDDFSSLINELNSTLDLSYNDSYERYVLKNSNNNSYENFSLIISFKDVHFDVPLSNFLTPLNSSHVYTNFTAFEITEDELEDAKSYLLSILPNDNDDDNIILGLSFFNDNINLIVDLEDEVVGLVNIADENSKENIIIIEDKVPFSNYKTDD